MDWDFQKLFMRHPVGRMAMTIADDGCFLFAAVNDMAAKYFDLPVDDIVGKTPAGIMDNMSAKKMVQALKKCVKTAKPVIFNSLPRFHGGVRMQVFILSPVFDEAEKVMMVDVMARPDMVDNVQVLRERDDALVMMTSIFDASGLGILVLDHNGRIVRMNDKFSFVYGWKQEDLLGEVFTSIIPPDDRDRSSKIYKIAIKRRHSGTRDIQVLRKDGTLADVQASSAWLELSQNRPFMVVTMRDQTERKNIMRYLQEAKEEADIANRAKSSFLANMSHELRTPLNAIIGFSEMMKNGTFGVIDNAKYIEYLSDIHFSARHLLDIINDVLDMSKIEAGQVNLVASSVSITEVLESVMRIVGDNAYSVGVMLDFRVEDDVPIVHADQRLLRQILINLVSNAVKFSKGGDKVLIHVFNIPSQLVRIRVKDEGCGIPDDMVEHVMKPFGQVNNPRNSAGQGTGLGLPLARAMAELHGGKLSINSIEGQGTEVLLDLPIENIVQE